MKIGVDLLPFQPPRTGIGSYQLHLLDAVLNQSNGIEYTGFGTFRWDQIDRIYIDALLREDAANQRSNNILAALRRYRQTQHFVQFLRSSRTTLRRRRFVRSISAQKLGAYHAFSFVVPAQTSVPTIHVIHDVSFIRMPHQHPSDRLRAMEPLANQLRSAALVHTVSHFSAREISEIFDVAPARIKVVYPGVKPIFWSSAAAAAWPRLQAQYQIKKRNYFLTVSTLEPRKNLKTLVDAYSRLPTRVRSRMPLCIAGASGWGSLDLPYAMKSLVRAGDIRLLGFVTDAELAALYSYSCAMFYPSLYEGFGMPIIEALACGTSVICSNVASMPEAAGDVCHLVPPLDVDRWTERMLVAADTTAGDKEEVQRREHASRFTWDKAAALTLDIYNYIARTYN